MSPRQPAPGADLVLKKDNENLYRHTMEKPLMRASWQIVVADFHRPGANAGSYPFLQSRKIFL